MRIEDEIKQTKPFRNVYHKASVNLILTGKWIFNFHNTLFKPYHLTVQQYNILRILKGQKLKAANLNLIQTRMLDKSSDASRIVELLRKKGLLKRNHNAQDRRRVDIIITRQGLDLLNEIEQKESRKMDNLLSALSPEEIALLNILLDKARK